MVFPAEAVEKANLNFRYFLKIALNEENALKGIWQCHSGGLAARKREGKRGGATPELWDVASG